MSISTGSRRAGKGAPPSTLTSRKSALPTRTRLRGQAAGGALLIIIPALLLVYVFLNTGERTEVLAIKDGVAAGQTIDRSDLVSKQVAGVDDAIALSDADSVIGKRAVSGLVKGQILTRSAITSDPVPGDGKALVGVALTPSQVPGEGLEAGDSVRVLAIPSQDGGSTTLRGQVVAELAQVYSVKSVTSGDATRQVTLVVPSADSDTVTTYAAAGRIALQKVPAPAGGS